MPETTVQPPQNQLSTPKRRKLTGIDAQAIAELVISAKMTEREACLNLNVNPDQWAVWKCRHKESERFESLCARLRGSEIAHSMRTIRNCGDGVGMKQPDWRAHAFRLSVIAPDRFAQTQAQPGTSQPQISVNVLLALSDKVYGAKQLPTVTTDVKQVIDTQLDKAKPAECQSVPQLKP